LRQRSDLAAIFTHRAAVGGANLQNRDYFCESVAVANIDPSLLVFITEHERFGREMADKLALQSAPALPYSVDMMLRIFRQVLTSELIDRGLPKSLIDLLIESALIGFFKRDCEIAVKNAKLSEKKAAGWGMRIRT
jgi:hypothetical protein